jgi:UDP-N-acetyl-D-mannosaminuronate dehydrogenase
MKIGIIGYGEIGSSIAKVYNSFGRFDVSVVDPLQNRNDNINGVEILNICIPFIDNFVEVVRNYISQSNPRYTIIHSTVSPGTTKLVGGKVCHSPMRGLHPNLDLGMKTFLKYIGPEDYESAKLYQEHLNSLGIKSYICKDSKTTEYAKLLDTTYYGLCIAFHADVANLCENQEIDFEEVMTLFNQSYNEGYVKLGKENVVRPVLYSTKKIGGHCVVPNAKILKDFMNTKIVQSILDYE